MAEYVDMEIVGLERIVDVFTLDEDLFNNLYATYPEPLRDDQIHVDSSDPDLAARGQECYGLLAVPYGNVRDFLEQTNSEFEVRDSKSGKYLRIQRAVD